SALAADSSDAASQKAPRAGATSISPPLPIGVEADVYCTGWLGEPDAEFPGSIFSAELINSKWGFFEGDVVYISGGANQGFAAGQEYWIVRPERLVNQVQSNLSVVGRVYLTPGRVRILCAQENSSIAEIVLSCSDTNVGDSVLPFEPIPIPLVRRTVPLSSCDPETGKVSGHIVADVDTVTAIAKDSVVYLDLGEDDGLLPGDFLSVFRLPVEDRSLRLIRGIRDLPAASEVRITLGEAAILTTRKKTSVAIITSMRDTMYVGDRVELK
ncbi:MAG TPA: hypothetical protein VL084_13700, partial [Thermoanaerobaculia bacterium]|nr:hypothetical protein [Thermoanaerobaculia bacterium]